MKPIQPCWVIGLTLLSLGLVLPPFVQAGDGEKTETSLTLEDCLQRAMTGNQALKAAYMRHQAALQMRPQVTSLPEPQVSWTHFIEQVQTRTGPQENLFMISQTIPWFGKLRLRGESADHEAKAARHRYEDARLALIRDVSLAYFDYAFLAKETGIVRESRDLLAELKPITEEQVRGGAPLTQQLTLELALGRLDSQLDDLSGKRAEASAKLRAAMGESASAGSDPLPWPELSDKGATIEGNLDSLTEQLRASHPRLAAMNQMVASAEAKTQLAHKNAIPDPTIGATVVDIGNQGDTAAGISIGFKIPLAFKKYRAERAEAAANEQAVVAKKEDAEIRLLAELDGAWERFLATGRTVRRYHDELLPSANRIIDVSESSYRAGAATIRDVIDDQRDALDVRKAYWRAVADLHSAAVKVTTLTGDEN